MNNNITRRYRAICFDLDGTLLPMDLDEFMEGYLSSIAAFAAARGLDVQRFMGGLKKGIGAMAVHDDDRTNEEAFWEAFSAVYGEGAEEVRALVGTYYERDFAKIGEGFAGHPAVPGMLAELKAKGYPLVLTTMPMFPRRAVEWRLTWAGVDPALFDRITTYENSKSAKPRQTYYAENLAAMGAAGSDVLMVGNNTQEDLAFLDLGADAYLVTDCLIDPVAFDLDAVKHGSMDEFAQWVHALPPCGDPVQSIERGAVPGEAMEAAFAANEVGSIDRQAAIEAAAAVASGATYGVACGGSSASGARSGAEKEA